MLQSMLKSLSSHFAAIICKFYFFSFSVPEDQTCSDCGNRAENIFCFSIVLAEKDTMNQIRIIVAKEEAANFFNRLVPAHNSQVYAKLRHYMTLLTECPLDSQFAVAMFTRHDGCKAFMLQDTAIDI